MTEVDEKPISVESGPDSAVACLVMMARFLEQTVDPAQVMHSHGTGAPFATPDLLRAAKRLGLKARAVKANWKRIQSVYLPAIAEGRDGQYFILAKAAEDKVLIQRPGGKPETLGRDDFEAQWAGRLILITSRQALAGDGRRFDISWFIPAIIKYRRLFGEVLLASFFIQLFGLITPLFFQVIIDKVLIHRGLSSLDVLIFALIVVSIFEVLIGGLRTYIFSHTTNRVDVELGAAPVRSSDAPADLLFRGAAGGHDRRPGAGAGEYP